MNLFSISVRLCLLLLVLEGNVEQHRDQEVPFEGTHGTNIRKVEDFTSGTKGLVSLPLSNSTLKRE
jgi:hypothetical protein